LPDDFNPVLDGTLYSLAVQTDGKILVGGNLYTGTVMDGIQRLNADGIRDSAFNPSVYGEVLSIAVQADGKILVGGDFIRLGVQLCSGFGRLNADGTLDFAYHTPFDDYFVESLVVQADGKILVGSIFTWALGRPPYYLCRLNAVGTLDSAFAPGADGDINSIAVQADGNILVGGGFSTLGGQPRIGIGRLNTDGTLDSAFDPRADGGVNPIAVQADGKILVGGGFSTLGGQPRNRIGRLNNTAPATQSLSYDGSKIIWLRGGTSPEVWYTRFDFSTNGLTWTSLGTGTRIPGGWRRLGVSFPPHSILRAQGSVSGSHYNGSGWFVEAYYGMPFFLLQPASRTNQVGTPATFSVIAGGSEPFSFQWRKDGVPLVDGGNIAGAATAVLSLTNLLGASAGAYSVVVSNGFGSVTSVVARLTVIDPVIAVQPVSQSGNVGESVKFSVTAVGTEPLRYQWRKDSVALVDGGNIAGAATAVLRLTNLLRASAGAYSVVVSNGFGSVTSAVATLVVGPTPPVILTGDGAFGVISNQFGFNVSGVSSQVVVVERSSNLLQWLPLQTNTLGSSPVYFSDPAWSQTPHRFYRARLGQ
jgi:uncharacterized delta-60 repeat protein